MKDFLCEYTRLMVSEMQRGWDGAAYLAAEDIEWACGQKRIDQTGFTFRPWFLGEYVLRISRGRPLMAVSPVKNKEKKKEKTKVQ